MRTTISKPEKTSAHRPSSMGITRREFIETALAAGASAGLCGALPTPGSAADASAGAKPRSPTIGLAFGTYGMKTLKTEEALRTIAAIGYDGVEPALMPGWPTDPAQLSAADRKALRRLIADTGLAVPAMLETLPLMGTPQSRASNLERLKRAIALGNELLPARTPIVETILGGRTAQWERVKGRMVDELKAWAKVAEDGQTTVCFKPHAGDAVQSPDRARWLVNEVGSPRIRIVYDYSHFFVEGFPLESSLKQLLAYAPLIVVKDSSGTPEKHAFLLPGDGKTDYLAYFRLLKQLRYAGFVAVEVSGMIHRQPGYQPAATAKLCYARLAPLLERAGIQRPERKCRA